MASQLTDKKRSDATVGLAILCALAFLNYLDRNLLYPLLGLIAKDLHLSETQLGALATGFFVVYAISAPVFGYVSDQFTRRSVLLLSLLFWSAVTALSGTATGFVSLLLWRSLTGLGEGGYFPTAVSLIGDLFGPRRRGMAIAVHGVCATLGGSAGYAVGGLFGESHGWRAPFFIAVVPGLVLAWFVWRRLPDPNRGANRLPEVEANLADAGPTDSRHPIRKRLAVLMSFPVLLISLAAGAANYSMSGLTTWFPRFLEQEMNLSVAMAGTLTGVTFAATIIGQLSGGYFSDRWAEKLPGARPLLVGASYLLAAPAILLIQGTSLLQAALMCFAITQIGRGFAEPSIYGTIIDSVESRSRGSAQGFLLLLTFIGGALSPIITGELIRVSGYGTALASLGIASGCAGILALVLFQYLRVRHVKPTAAASI